MRRLFAITMLAAYLFNLAGYRFFFQYSILRADQQIVQQLDKNQYRDAELVEVKIKLNLPYMSDWGAYERCEGETEFRGVHYNFVKRKVSQDTLYLLCVPNNNKTALYKGNDNYWIRVNDIPAGKESNNSTAKKNISTNDYRQQVIQYDFSLTALQVKHGNSSPLFHIPVFFVDTPGKPPEVSC